MNSAGGQGHGIIRIYLGANVGPSKGCTGLLVSSEGYPDSIGSHFWLHPQAGKACGMGCRHSPASENLLVATRSNRNELEVASCQPSDSSQHHLLGMISQERMKTLQNSAPIPNLSTKAQPEARLPDPFERDPDNHLHPKLSRAKMPPPVWSPCPEREGLILTGHSP